MRIITHGTLSFRSLVSIHQSQNIVSKLKRQFCQPVNIKLVFTKSKIKGYFSTKDVIAVSIKSMILYNIHFVAVTLVMLVTTRAMRIREHLKSEKSSHIYQHLHESPQCKYAVKIVFHFRYW